MWQIHDERLCLLQDLALQLAKGGVGQQPVLIGSQNLQCLFPGKLGNVSPAPRARRQCVWGRNVGWCGRHFISNLPELKVVRQGVRGAEVVARAPGFVEEALGTDLSGLVHGSIVGGRI
jgi:hypothetical protein